MASAATLDNLSQFLAAADAALAPLESARLGDDAFTRAMLYRQVIAPSDTKGNKICNDAIINGVLTRADEGLLHEHVVAAAASADVAMAAPARKALLTLSLR